jgi:hypothetical protein
MASADADGGLADAAARGFAETCRRAPEVVWSAPGRVNLIGEHTQPHRRPLREPAARSPDHHARTAVRLTRSRLAASL